MPGVSLIDQMRGPSVCDTCGNEPRCAGEKMACTLFERTLSKPDPRHEHKAVSRRPSRRLYHKLFPGDRDPKIEPTRPKTFGCEHNRLMDSCADCANPEVF